MKLFKKLFLLMLVVSVLFVSCGNNEIKTPGNGNVPESNVPDAVIPGAPDVSLNPELVAPEGELVTVEYYVGLLNGENGILLFPKDVLLAKMSDAEFNSFKATTIAIAKENKIEGATVTRNQKKGIFKVELPNFGIIQQLGDGNWIMTQTFKNETYNTLTGHKISGALDFLNVKQNIIASGWQSAGKYRVTDSYLYSRSEDPEQVKLMLKDIDAQLLKAGWKNEAKPKEEPRYSKEGAEIEISIFKEPRFSINYYYDVKIDADDYSAGSFMFMVNEYVLHDKPFSDVNYTKMTEAESDALRIECPKLIDYPFYAGSMKFDWVKNESFKVSLQYEGDSRIVFTQDKEGKWNITKEKIEPVK